MGKSKFYRFLIIFSTVVTATCVIGYAIEPVRDFSFEHLDAFKLLLVFMETLSSITWLWILCATITDKETRRHNGTMLILYTGFIIVSRCFFVYLAYIGRLEVKIYALERWVSQLEKGILH